MLFFITSHKLLMLSAMGYIDPGSGSVLFQVLLAALVGGIFYLRNFILRFFRYLRTFFSRKSNGD
jgi:hydrogenase-4 membrane subunit HyfE